MSENAPDRSGPPVVGVLMGSDSDWPVMGGAAEVLEHFAVPYEARVLSAHRTPHDMLAHASEAAALGRRVLICGAGGAAHLPGMVASATHLPVIGVPVEVGALRGFDALLSIAQMPAGIPVATVAVNGARNAGLLAVRILATSDDDLAAQMQRYQHQLAEESRAKTVGLDPG